MNVQVLRHLHQPPSPMSRQKRPTLLFAARIFGGSGRPWMWRQVIGLKQFRKELICWERVNRLSQPTSDVQEHVFDGNPAPYDGPGRWAHRLRALASGNLYAAVGGEKARLRAFFQAHRPDILLCHFGDIAMRLLPVAKEAGVPLVAYFHGDFPFLRNRFYRWSLRRTAKHFAAIVVVTPEERQWLEANGVAPEKIHYIPCGAPTDIFKPRQDRSQGPVRFVMVSRLSPEKGCAISIEAFSRVAEAVPDVSLSIFGEGEDQAELEALVDRLGIGDRVSFRGHIDETSLARELPEHDVFIQHSRFREGSPVSVVEAMACALPVVSTAIGGIVDQVIDKETGFIVRDGDIEAMAKRMLSLAEDGALRHRMGRAGRAHCLSAHDAANQTRLLGELLVKVARK